MGFGYVDRLAAGSEETLEGIDQITLPPLRRLLRRPMIMSLLSSAPAEPESIVSLSAYRRRKSNHPEEQE